MNNLIYRITSNSNLLTKAHKYFNRINQNRSIFSSIPKPKDSNPQLLKASPKYNNEFSCVYEFRYIKEVRFLNRAKIYQTVLACSLGVASVVMYDFNILSDLNTILGINALMVFALVMLFIISRQTVRVVGKMYLNEDKSKVLISHLSFLGKRKDLLLDINEIRPIASISELGERISYLKLKNSEGSMMLSVPYGRIYNKKDFLKIFGIE